jgi:hypothetical protein
MWRTIELKKSIYRLPSGDPELAPWQRRLGELVSEQDPVDRLLAEIAAIQPDGTIRDPRQLELFGTLLQELQGMQRRPQTDHRVKTTSGVTYAGTWEEIVFQMKSAAESPRNGRDRPSDGRGELRAGRCRGGAPQDPALTRPPSGGCIIRHLTRGEGEVFGILPLSA